MKRPKLLSQHDVEEINQFRIHLEDMRTMPRDAFYRKYQEYMGLSDDELSGILAKKAKGTL